MAITLGYIVRADEKNREKRGEEERLVTKLLDNRPTEGSLSL